MLDDYIQRLEKLQQLIKIQNTEFRREIQLLLNESDIPSEYHAKIHSICRIAAVYSKNNIEELNCELKNIFDPKN